MIRMLANRFQRHVTSLFCSHSVPDHQRNEVALSNSFPTLFSGDVSALKPETNTLFKLLKKRERTTSSMADCSALFQNRFVPARIDLIVLRRSFLNGPFYQPKSCTDIR